MPTATLHRAKKKCIERIDNEKLFMFDSCNLKPCPFCGAKAKSDTGFLPCESVIYVWCSNEDCALSPIGRNEKLFSVDFWNTRS